MAEAAIILGKPETRAKAIAWVKRAPDGTALIFRSGDKRTLEQNSMLHDLLTDISRQVPWYGRSLTIDAWKDVLTAAYRTSKHELEIVPGLDGGFVMLGMHTSKMTKAELSDLIELALAFGAEKNVRWTGEPRIAEQMRA